MSWFKSSRSDASQQPNFSKHAQKALAFSRNEADRFNHNFVGTEHLLLGIIRLGQGMAVTVLQKMGADLETVRLEVEKQVGTGPGQKMTGNIPYTPRAKKVLALAAKESRALNQTYVGTEHILLGLIQEGDGVGARVLKNLDIGLEATREEILKELDPNGLHTPVSRLTVTEPPRSGRYSVDASKRYDIYCVERNREVVYRNALFKSTKSLFPSSQFDRFPDFVEIEQADGKTIFVAKHAVIKFCEHGVTPGSETTSSKQP